MTRNRILIAIVVLMLPLLGRGLWYYHGVFQRTEPITTPDFANLVLPPAPVSTPIPQVIKPNQKSAPIGPRILFDISHENMFSVSELEPVMGLLNNQGADVQLSNEDTQLDDQLKSSDAYIVIAPNLDFSNTDIETIHQFVSRGGRLLIITDPTRDKSSYSYIYGDSASKLQSVHIANKILEPYNTAFMEDYLYDLSQNEANFRNVILTQTSEDDLTTGLSKVVFYGTHSLKTNQKTLIEASDTTFSSLTDATGTYPTAVSAANGQVIAIGDFTFMTDPFYKNADNQILLVNLSNFLINNNRQRKLADFPYVFKRPVILLTKNDTTIDKAMLDTITEVQTGIRAINLSLTFSSTPVVDYDLLVLGLYQNNEEFSQYIKSFNLKFENIKAIDPTAEPGSSTENNGQIQTNTSLNPTPTPLHPATPEGKPQLTSTPDVTKEPASAKTIKPIPSFENPGIGKEKNQGTITIPSIGKFSVSGVGLILISRTQERNTLILLAESNEGVYDLVKLFSNGSLSDCTIQDDIAVCPVSKAVQSQDPNSSSLSNTYDTPFPGN